MSDHDDHEDRDDLEGLDEALTDATEDSAEDIDDRDPISEAITALKAQAEPRPAGDHGPPGVRLAVDNDAELLRIVEALFFAASEPLDIDTLRSRLPDDRYS